MREEHTRWKTTLGAFGDWWQLLNQELAALNEAEAGFGDARYHYNANYSPMTAAKIIAENRAEKRQP